MTETNQTSVELWPIKRAMILAAAFLVLGLVAGWFIRGWENPAASANTAPAAANPATGSPAAPAADATRLKQAADTQAAPLLDQLRSNPQNPDLLVSVGNLYYDAQQYPTAIEYYGRALQARPTDANVRTDMGTAYWYMGNADAALAQFNQALTYAPDNPNTLYNRGLVKWQGKKDGAGALADWEKLLATNPNYQGRDKVEQMMAEVKTQSAASLPLKTN